MIYWFREVVGWALLGLGLFCFAVVWWCLFLQPPGAPIRIIEAGPTTFIGFVLFRGGIALIRVAVAARICQQAALQFPERARPLAPVARLLPGGRTPAAATPPRRLGA
jgi:hypothetical protein